MQDIYLTKRNQVLIGSSASPAAIDKWESVEAEKVLKVEGTHKWNPPQNSAMPMIRVVLIEIDKPWSTITPFYRSKGYHGILTMFEIAFLRRMEAFLHSASRSCRYDVEDITRIEIAVGFRFFDSALRYERVDND